MANPAMEMMYELNTAFILGQQFEQCHTELHVWLA